MDPAIPDNDRPVGARADNDRPADEKPDDARVDDVRPDDALPASARSDSVRGGDPPPPDDLMLDGPLPGRPPGQPLGRALAVGAGAVLALAFLGGPLGLLWAALAPDVPVIKTADGAVLAQSQPEEFIAADGWFSLLGVGFGILAALAVWKVLPRWRGPAGMLMAVAGSLGAALVAWGLGRQVGLDGYRERLAEAPIGEALAKPADLRAGGFEWFLDVIPTVQGDLLLGAFGAAVTYTLLAGWSSYPDLVPGQEVPTLITTEAYPVGVWNQEESGGMVAGGGDGVPLADEEEKPGRERPDPVAAADGDVTADGDVPAGGIPSAGEVSSDSPETRDPQASPAPPGSGEAGPARG